jgi:ribosomal protein L11 methyltransferase
MQWIEAKVSFDYAPQTLAQDLISEIFYALGASGVVIEGPEAEPDPHWADGAPPMPQQDAVIAYFPKNRYLDETLRELERQLRRLRGRGIASRLACRPIDEADWANAWKDFFWPQKVAPGLVVRPSWREYRPEPGETVIVIDPGMAFGTGTHPTTTLCLGLIQKHLRPGDRFLDIGTGSGILMVAAAKLGAESLTGTDSDPVATEIAAANLRLNRISPQRFELHTGDLLAGVTGRFDLIVANILSPVILRLLDALPGYLKNGGRFIGSGIIEKNSPQVAEKMAAQGLCLRESLAVEDWVALVARRSD